MEIKAFTTRGCKYCGHLKELFDRADVTYEEVVVSERETDYNMEVFKQQYPEVIGFPHVIIDGESVGGLVEVAKLFLEKGLVSSKKK